MNKSILFILLFAVTANAAEPVCSEQQTEAVATESMEIKTDVPSHLKGATITVRLADGRETTVPAERFKVVPRKQQFIVTKTEKSKMVSCTSNDPAKNRIALLGGHGAQAGLNSSVSGTTTEVESNVGLVGGLQYQRLITDTISLGVQGQTNKTGSVMIGLDF